MLRISIIIPVYNAENYLKNCLESVLRQGLAQNEYEVILVDDGSTDNSLEICEEYSRHYSQIRFVSQENAGVAIARNRGIEEAKGEFIGFLDADDYLLDNGLKLACYPYVEQGNIDVIHYYSSYDFWPKSSIDNIKDFEGDGWDLIIRGGLPSFCWLCLYRRSFLDREKIRFKQYIVGEDQLFSSHVYIANPHIVSTRANIYRYVVNEGSATTKRNIEHTRRCVVDYVNSYRDIMDLLTYYHVGSRQDVYAACIKSLNSKKMFGVSRIMSAKFNYMEFKSIKALCRKTGFFPVMSYSSNLKVGLMRWAMNKIMYSFFFYKSFSFLFNRIVTPYILPKLRVNL